MKLGDWILKLDELNHKLHLNWDWPCELLDISCGMTEWNMPAPPGLINQKTQEPITVLNRVHVNPLTLGANWYFNSFSRWRHPLRWRRHDRGEHWIQECWIGEGPRVDWNQMKVLRKLGVRPMRFMRHDHLCYLCDYYVRDVVDCEDEPL